MLAEAGRASEPEAGTDGVSVVLAEEVTGRLALPVRDWVELDEDTSCELEALAETNTLACVRDRECEALREIEVESD